MAEKIKRNILILGATSSIGRATAIAFAEKGDTVYLAGRDLIELEKISTDIHIRYQTETYCSEFDIEKTDDHKSFFETVLKTITRIDGVIFAIGAMGESPIRIFNINLIFAVLILEICAKYFEKQKSGFIIGISSCAGDRGRQSNYLYGAAKGGFSIYLQGLRNKLFKNNIRVITIKPGFVDTPMTFGLPGLFLVASPEKIGQLISATPESKKDVFYLPWFWAYIMCVIKVIPEFIFKRMSL